MNKIYKIALIFMAAVALTACQKDSVEQSFDKVPDGYVKVNATLQVPDMKQVSTRGVDPDGKGIHSMTLFCFDNFGLFISYSSSGSGEGTGNVQITTGEPVDGYSLSGTITSALVPENTRRIHFVANQNMANFSETDFVGLHEAEVMTKLQGSSGMMIYWGRYVAPQTVTSGSQLAEVMNNSDLTIKMLRNQARFTVEKGAGAPESFEVKGFAVVNTSAYGTVAPLHPTKGFDFSIEGNDSDWHTTSFLTLPDNKARLTPPNDIDAADDTCVFETENNSAHPVSVIIKGNDNRYYRVMIVDGNDYIDIRRNHHYKINIVGALSYGVATFAEALTAPATNNVWISIADEVNEVQNGEWILGVDETSIVVVQEPIKDNNGTITGYKFVKPNAEDDFELVGANGSTLEIGYHLKRVNNTETGAANVPAISWVGENNVASDSFVNDFMANGNGLLKLSLTQLADGVQSQQGTLLIEKGLLQRKIKVIIIRRQEFKPMWVTTQMYGGDTNTSTPEFDGSDVTLLFTIPESCPDELLPMEVYISVDHLDLRSESGVSLPIIRNNDPRYGVDIKRHPNEPSNDEVIGYKYVYTATKKGDQRVYFKNILNQANITQHEGHQQYVTVESPYFETLAKPFVFSSDNHKRAITITNLRQYNAFNNGSEHYVSYILVPQKKGASIEFNLRFMNGNSPMSANIYNGAHGVDVVDATGGSDDSDGFDELLLYSEYLDHDTHDRDNDNCYAEFYKMDDGSRGTMTRTFGMRMPRDATTVGSNSNIYPVRMHTNTAKSAEVVRLASNQVGSPVIWGGNTKKNGEGNYTGNTYKSVIFELANFRAFRFAAQINGVGNYVHHEQPLGIADTPQTMLLPYAPNAKVNVAFDITDFNALIANQVDERGMDINPFGRGFKIYIDAPMLAWDETSLIYTALRDASKIGVEGGKFYYLVDKDRQAEAQFWTNLVSTINNESILSQQDITTKHDQSVVDIKNDAVVGERKVLPFKKNSVAVSGQIVISSEIEEVIFDEAVFNTSNAPITGTITYGDDASTQTIVPKNAFVIFKLKRNSSRIGSLTVGDNGNYTLSLRSEYQFNWESDPIEVTYEENGDYYSATIADLKTLVESTDIQLTKVVTTP